MSRERRIWRRKSRGPRAERYKEFSHNGSTRLRSVLSHTRSLAATRTHPCQSTVHLQDAGNDAMLRRQADEATEKRGGMKCYSGGGREERVCIYVCESVRVCPRVRSHVSLRSVACICACMCVRLCQRDSACALGYARNHCLRAYGSCIVHRVSIRAPFRGRSCDRIGGIQYFVCLTPVSSGSGDSFCMLCAFGNILRVHFVGVMCLYVSCMCVHIMHVYTRYVFQVL